MTTDGEGRWSFKSLPACRYTLTASKEGYLSLEYAQRRARTRGEVIALAAAGRVDNLDFILPKGGVIAGTIDDDTGEPFPGIRVSALQLQYRDGRPRLAAAGKSAVTDDLGGYRIYGLAPGDYVVAATPAASPFSDSDDLLTYRTAYYPGSPLPSNATRVQISIGQELRAIDFDVAAVPDATISGIALGSNGAPMRAAVVMLKAASASAGGISLSAPVQVGADGTFKIAHVAPGEYRLESRSMADLERLANVGSTAEAFVDEFASMPISVDGTDLHDVVLTALPAGLIHGQFRIAPGVASAKTPRWTDLRVGILSPDSDDLSPSAAMTIQDDGAFVVRAPAGRWLFRLRSQEWSLGNVVADGLVVTDTGIEVQAGKTRSGVIVTLHRPETSIDGTVIDATGALQTDYEVVVFATDETKWGFASRFVKTASPDQNGRFALTNLPDGDYFVVALDYLERGRETDPDLLRRLRAVATRLRVSGQPQTISLLLRLGIDG